MLKQLNGIAAGLLGLHGYPVEPFSSAAACQPPALSDPAVGRGSVVPRATEATVPERNPLGAALHC